MREYHRRMADFWARHPALFFGICLFLGVHVVLVPLCAWDLLFLLIVPLVFAKTRCLFALALFLLAALSTLFRVERPSIPGTYQGEVCGYVLDRQQTHYHGKLGYVVQFYISRFEDLHQGVHCFGMSLPIYCQSSCPFTGGIVYSFPARLVFDADGRGSLHVIHNQSIVENSTCASIVEWRVRARRSLERIFAVLFPDQEVRQIAGTLTFALQKGDLLQESMHRCGVEHLLAVSGFHFGIIAALLFALGRGLRKALPCQLCLWFMSVPVGVVCALVLLTGYLLIIGPLPSVVRAYTACTVALMASCFNRRANGLQALGCGLIVAVLCDPMSTCSLGFELSFLATFGIVLFSSRFEQLLSILFPTRSLFEVAQFSILDQFFRFIVKRFVPIFALLASVMIVVVPYELTYLQEFSLMGVVYNLLIPALLSLALPCILCAVLTFPFPYIAMPCAFLAEIPLRIALYFVNHSPVLHYSMIDGAALPLTIGRLLIITVSIVGIYLSGEESEKHAWQGCL